MLLDSKRTSDMPGKTLGDKIDDLSRATAALKDRIDGVEGAVQAAKGEHSRTVGSLAETLWLLAAIEQRLNELKKSVEESARRRWTLLPALVGGLLGFLGALMLSGLQK
jgi:hypothetical protein